MEKCPPSRTSAEECSLVLRQSVWPAKAHLPTEHDSPGRWVSDEGSSASPGNRAVVSGLMEPADPKSSPKLGSERVR